MFDVSCSYHPYPCRSIVMDVLMRRRSEGEAGSFFNLPGCRDILVYDKRNVGLAMNYELSRILEGMADYNADKDHPVDWSEEAAQESAQDREGDYYRRLEDIDIRWIEAYARNVIVGFRVNKSGLTKEKKENCEGGYMTDIETGETILATDLEVVDHPFTMEERLEAETKLPYVLKLLHQGSEKYGVHLLSFIIAKVGLLGRSSGIQRSFTAIDYVRYGVYKMQGDGHIGRQCIITDNNDTHSTYGFRFAMAWISGMYPDDFYYKAANDLIHIADVLEVDLEKEDPLQYDKPIIESVVCQYLATNKEYIESGGYGDPKVLELLKADNLFRVVQDVSREAEYEVRSLTEEEKADIIGTCVSSYNERVSLATKKNLKCDSDWGVDRMDVVDEFLRFQTKGTHSICEYEERKSLLWNPKKQAYIRFKGETVTDLAAYRNTWGYLSTSGNLVLQNDILTDNIILYVSLSEYLEVARMGRKAEVRYVSILCR